MQITFNICDFLGRRRTSESRILPKQAALTSSGISKKKKNEFQIM